MTFSISYIISTRNRRPFLKLTMERLIKELQPDEEIVVVDGSSTDGSKEYLQQLLDEGKIHQFVSETDKNQAHGWNKAMLMARGEVIKKIIDDDVFCYPAIRKCKDFMLQHPQADLVISNDLSSAVADHLHIEKLTRLPQFEKWQTGQVSSFTFGDVHMLIRRSALALIGLYNTAFVMMDWEYSLRISYAKARIAYFTGYNALSVAHLQTVSSSKNKQLIADQGKRGSVFYEYEGDSSGISAWSKLKIAAGKRLKPGVIIKETPSALTAENIDAIYSYYYNYITDLNNAQEFTFLFKD